MVEINKGRFSVNSRELKKVAEKFLIVYRQQKKELSIALVGDRVMTNLNGAYRRKFKPTDILSFAGQGDFLGELIIDYPQIKRQAPIYGRTVKEELIFILVHGLLHLVGYRDDTESKRLAMIRRGEEFIKKLKK